MTLIMKSKNSQLAQDNFHQYELIWESLARMGEYPPILKENANFKTKVH